ncbi:MAG: pentapeptide repeat-containing protein [Phycisphaeraceae bacterium]|nr:pentapeptide repeat-containing protein [Phycisphaeraceae bacterium]
MSAGNRKKSSANGPGDHLWDILRAGGPFEDFPRHDGRIDLRNKRIAVPRVKDVGAFGPYPVGRLSLTPSLRKVYLKDIDFSGSKLIHLQMAQSSFTNCRFDIADFRYWLMWSTRIADCSFVGTRLDESQLGAVLPDGSQNRFKRVKFVRSRMKHVDCAGAVFDECLFENVAMDGTEFGSACSFTHCTFRGEIHDVQFGSRVLLPNDQRRLYGELPRGILDCVDFSRAVLRYVAFGDVQIGDVRWPDPTTHVVLTGYRSCIDRLLAAFARTGADEVASRYFHTIRESLGEHEEVGVFYKPDLINLLGKRTAVRVLSLLEDLQS